MSIYRNINVRSPFYVQLATSQPQVDLELRIWEGTATGSKPASATYTMTKEQSGGQATFEIAELVRDYISQTQSLASGTIWVETITDDRVATPTTAQYLASEGYSLYVDGVQHNGNTWESDFVALPVNGAGEYEVLVPHNAQSFFQVYTQPQNSTDWTYTTYDVDGVLDAVETMSEVDSSQAKFVTFQIGNNVSRIDFDLNGDLFTVKAVYTDCSKYNNRNSFSSVYGNHLDGRPAEVLFVNKYGAKQSIPFTMKHMEQVSNSSDGFQRNVVNLSGLNTGNGKHAYRKRITGSKQSFTVNTDNIKQYFVSQLEELVMSEYVWIKVPSFRDTYIPVNLKTSNLDKKNHLNDKLIQYSFKFESAGEYINTVR